LLESRELLDSTPLSDLGTGLYQGYMGGLYPGGADTPPAATEAYALNLAQHQIVPLDSNGNPNPKGSIVMVSLGMSNSQEVFNTFKNDISGDRTINPQLITVNGAQSGFTAEHWANPADRAWTWLNQSLTSSNVTPAQVEVAWVELFEQQPFRFGAFPLHAQQLQSYMESTARNLLTAFPNIKIAYFSPINHTYTTSLSASAPEPYAYESDFSIQWMMQDQINGTGNLNYNPANGTVVAPLLLWGPYLWAPTTPRSDGFTWLLSDVTSDLVHASPTGKNKEGEEMVAFFKSDATATPWVLRPTTSPPIVTASASSTSGSPGLTVQFTASATDPYPIFQYVWTYSDGTFAFTQNATKSFLVPGTFNAYVTVSDNHMNSATVVIPITITSGSLPKSRNTIGAIIVASARPAASLSVTISNVTSTSSQVVHPGVAALPAPVNQERPNASTLAALANAGAIAARRAAHDRIAAQLLTLEESDLGFV
jgi:PKD repeat protein